MGDADKNNKPSGTCKPVFLNSSNVFVYDKPSNMIGQFDVNVISSANKNKDTVITSVGTVGNVEQTVTVTIKPVTTEIPISQGPKVTGDTLKWYNPNSGQASVGNHTIGDKGVTVLVSDPGLKVVHGTPVYQADIIRFTTGIWNFKYPLTLKVGMLSFDSTITISTNRNGGNDGRLILQVLPLASVTRIDKSGEWGRIKYKSQWYYYSDETEIVTDADFNSLDKIPITDPNFPSSDKQQISSYSITWS